MSEKIKLKRKDGGKQTWSKNFSQFLDITSPLFWPLNPFCFVAQFLMKFLLCFDKENSIKSWQTLELIFPENDSETELKDPSPIKIEKPQFPSQTFFEESLNLYFFVNPSCKFLWISGPTSLRQKDIGFVFYDKESIISSTKSKVTFSQACLFLFLKFL